VDELIFVCRF